CIAVNRIIVADRIYDRFVQAITALTEATALGHGIEPGVHYGPCTTDKVRRHVQLQLDDALSRGARLLTGGQVPKGDLYDRGFFYRPTLVDNLAEDALILRDETFGPLTGILRAGSDEQALRMANATPF